MGKDPDTPFEVDPFSAIDVALPELKEAYARALDSRPRDPAGPASGEENGAGSKATIS